MFKLNFINQKTNITVTGGLLSEACSSAGFPLDLVCGGKGTCGKCLVTIEVQGHRREVLACQFTVEEDLTVYLEDSQYLDQASLLTGHHNDATLPFDPALRKTHHTLSDLTPEGYSTFLRDTSLTLRRKFSHMVNQKDVSGMTVVRHQGLPVDIQPGDTTEHLYGGAIDIGTTSVVLYVYDLIDGSLLCTESSLNKQITFGGDVIARILCCQERESALDEQCQAIAHTINELLRRCEGIHPGLLRDFYHLVLCGNSTMAHLFFAMDPQALGRFPYANITEDAIHTHNHACGLNLPDAAVIDFLPLLGGFVGADTTSVLLTLPQDDRKYLMVDLGTNGEIALGNAHSGFQTASTACGPALEGANIECGMRASAGAIESIALEKGKICCQVIGGGTPIGLCGSAIVDAVAVLRSLGVIDPSGYLLTPEEYLTIHPGSPLAAHLAVLDTPDQDVVFYFSRGDKPVYLSQGDIRQIQLAKSSIYSGCMTLLKECGLTLSDVDALVLAGAFGNFINIENALAIGLLPPFPRDKILAIGNGAGHGVQRCLLNQGELDRASQIQACTEQTNLADTPEFMEAYIMNMNFN